MKNPSITSAVGHAGVLFEGSKDETQEMRKIRRDASRDENRSLAA